MSANIVTRAADRFPSKPKQGQSKPWRRASDPRDEFGIVPTVDGCWHTYNGRRCKECYQVDSFFNSMVGMGAARAEALARTAEMAARLFEDRGGIR